MAVDRRRFLLSAAAGIGLAAAPGAWFSALGRTIAPGAGPYGPLGEPDANGLRLPAGFTSRVVGRTFAPVLPSAYVWHVFPDGGATYPTDDGGWIYVSNSEVPTIGGAGAIRFAADGEIVDAYRILDGTSSNCAGGPTPWGTWLSCEEADDGRVWECDPTGATDAVALPAMGVFAHEAVAVDPVHRRLYLTEDVGDGRFYRFTPTAYPDLGSGTLEAAAVDPGGRVTWLAIPDPAATTTPTRHQLPATTPFDGGEGLWWDKGLVYFSTKGDNRIWVLDTATDTISVLYDAATIGESAPLTGVDNIVVTTASGDVYVAEDGGNLELVMITPEGHVAPFLQVTGQVSSELCGPAFSPDGQRLYISSQRGGLVPNDVVPPVPGQPGSGFGLTYEVTGPFRKASTVPARSTATTIAAASGSGGGTTPSGDQLPVTGGLTGTLAGAATLAAAAAAAMRLRSRTGQHPPSPGDR